MTADVVLQFVWSNRDAMSDTPYLDVVSTFSFCVFSLKSQPSPGLSQGLL